MALSPLALCRPYRVDRHMPLPEREEKVRGNQRFLQRWMPLYVQRSARLTLANFILFHIGFLIPGPLLTVTAGVLMLMGFLHLTMVIFWLQHLDNLLGPLHPPE